MNWKGRIEYSKPSMDCHIGGRSQNQDYVAQMDTSIGKLLIVCDGVGGNNGGAIASEKATEYIKNNIEKQLSQSSSIKSGLLTAIENAHTYVRDLSYDNPSLSGMATTIVACILEKDKAHIAHSGDSRLLVLRNNNLIYSSSDHSVIQKLIDSGHLSEKESLSHPEANVVLNAIGIQDGFYIEYNELTITKGDRFVLASDGLFGMYTNAEVISKMTSDDKITLDKLIYECNAKGMAEGGNHDNIGIILYTHSYVQRDGFPLKLSIATFIFLLSGIFVYYKYVIKKSHPSNNVDIAVIESLTVPDKTEVSQELLLLMNQYLDDFEEKIEKAQENNDLDKESNGYRQYINLIDQFCIMEGDTCSSFKTKTGMVRLALEGLNENYSGLNFNKTDE